MKGFQPYVNINVEHDLSNGCVNFRPTKVQDTSP